MDNKDGEQKAARAAMNAARGKQWQYILSHLEMDRSDLEVLSKMLGGLQHVENGTKIYYVGAIKAAQMINAATPETLDQAIEYIKSKTK